MTNALLVGDIGGTKSNFAVFSPDNTSTPLFQKRFQNADYASFQDVVSACAAELDSVPAHACFAIAGLVGGGYAQMTNLSWDVSAAQLENDFGFTRVLLINDLTAVANSLHLLDHENPNDLHGIYIPARCGGEISAVIAPGTGLGEGFVVNTDGRRFATGTEGGHTDFGPVDDEQMALLDWMRKKKTPVSYEMLIAGPGLAKLYDFCKFHHGIAESAAVVAQMQGGDRTPAIVAGVTEDTPCPLCARTINLFLRILGSEAANLALKTYARGGVYLGGGILPRLLGHVDFEPFVESFLAKGAMRALMEEISVRLIVNPKAPLIGAAGYLLDRLDRPKAVDS